jgi:hypothetical protein
MMAGLKLNEIKSMIKIGNLIKTDRLKVRGSFSKRWPLKFCSETFYNGFENLIQMPKYEWCQYYRLERLVRVHGALD